MLPRIRELTVALFPTRDKEDYLIWLWEMNKALRKENTYFNFPQ